VSFSKGFFGIVGDAVGYAPTMNISSSVLRRQLRNSFLNSISIVLVAASVFVSSLSQSSAVGLPGAITLPAHAIGPGSAILAAFINANFNPTTLGYIEYWEALSPTATNRGPPHTIGFGATDSYFRDSYFSLKPETDYYFRVFASNQFGINYGSNLTFRTGVYETVGRGTVQNLTSNSAVLSAFVNPGFPSVPGLFEWGTDTNYANRTPVLTIEGTSLVQAAVSNLTLLTTYHFRLVITNGGCCVVYGPDSAFTPGAAAAPTATTSNVTDVAASSATVHGIIAPNGLQTDWRVDLGTTTNYGLSLPSGSNAGPALSLSGTNAVETYFRLTGLLARTTYHYRFKAQNSLGTNYGADAVFTTLEDPNALTVVTSNARITTASQALLSGAVVPKSGVTVTYFEWGPTTNYANRTAPSFLSTAPTAVTFQATLGNLMPNTAYHFRAVATNSTGAYYGVDSVFSTPLTSQPSVLTEVSTNTGAVAATVSGNVNPNGLATAAFFQWGVTTNYGTTTATQMFAAGSVTVPVQGVLAPLTSNTVYHYRLVATNADGIAFGKDFILTTGEGLALNESESWTYEFHDLPFVRQNPCQVCGGFINSYSFGSFAVLPETFLPGSAIRFELFESLPSQSPAFLTNEVLAPNPGTNQPLGFGPWLDRQGSVRFTMLTGSVVIARVGFVLEYGGFRILDEYANTIVPSKFPQPPWVVSQSLASISFQSATALAEVNPRNTNASIYFQWGRDDELRLCQPSGLYQSGLRRSRWLLP
jgi:hypothetical protein